MTSDERKVIVVAGGTGRTGRHIVDGILATKKYIVKVFTRHDSLSSNVKMADGVQVVKVNYTDRSSLVRELHGVHTVIVCLISFDDSSVQSQLNLLDASVEANIKRFAPSEWVGNSGKSSVIGFYRKLKVPVLDRVKASTIEYTVFMNGLFMDYFALPQKASPYLSSLVLGVDFNRCEADIVGTGDEPFCVTRAEDVGRFVAAALELDRWDEQSGIVGSRTTWNELIALGEQVRGQRFKVKRTPVAEALNHQQLGLTDEFATFLNEVLVAMSLGEFDYRATLNEKFPEIVLTTINEFLDQWWAGKQGQTF